MKTRLAWMVPALLLMLAVPGQGQQDRSVQQLIKDLKDPSESQRIQAARELGKLGDQAQPAARVLCVMALDDQGGAADSDITHVMVRLKPPELEIVDTLITAGIANSRAEAIRWALARISERPAYAQLREHTRDIQRLTTEF